MNENEIYTIYFYDPIETDHLTGDVPTQKTKIEGRDLKSTENTGKIVILVLPPSGDEI